LRMPAEVTPFLAAIIQAATKYIKFDPVSTFMRPIMYEADSYRELCRRRRR
jgi:hypothetical protein